MSRESPPALAGQFARFVVVGVIGFAVDALLFMALTDWYVGWQPYAARAVSAGCSITTTWLLNRNVTFSSKKSADVRSEYLRYVATQVFGLVLNLGVFAAGVAFVPLMRREPLIALVLGAAVALFVNFLTARQIAFRGPAAAAKRLPP